MTEAGRELDRLIAEKVMGCYVQPRHRNGRQRYDLVIPGGVDQIDFVEPDAPWSACPHYGTDIAATWQVVEKISGGEHMDRWEIVVPGVMAGGL